MAGYKGKAIWADEVYIIAEDDPVQGGIEGIDNLSHVDLADRTAFLKQVDELLDERLTALEKAIPATIQRKQIYSLNDINTNYTVTTADIASNKILRVDSSVATTVTIPTLADLSIGDNFTVRRINAGVTIAGTNGVSILPADSCELRREGSTATLIYVGNNIWDIYTELGA